MCPRAVISGQSDKTFDTCGSRVDRYSKLSNSPSSSVPVLFKVPSVAIVTVSIDVGAAVVGPVCTARRGVQMTRSDSVNPAKEGRGPTTLK